MAVMAAAATAAAAGACFYLFNSGSSRVFLPCPSASLKLSSLPSVRKLKLFFPHRQCTAAQDTELEVKEDLELTQEWEAGESILQGEANRRKLYVVNLPWSYSASDLENLFGQCGAVDYVEVIKMQDGRNRGLAFVTMDSPEAAQAAIDKLNSFELAGRIIKVELAKSFSKPSPKKPQPITPVGETRHKIYVGNLHWKARAGNLREFFSTKFKPVSARVVFENPSGRSAGYGFVSFDTKQEVETVISELDGMELMGRPLRLRVSQKNGNESETRQEDSTQGHFE
ncbi:28 kDa ribonucleoprotein, chloroplastic [Phalaenopsis equestris]|uniref:28 kDa ribonucleoprotein, chloroplastic n=1 Tax=Phalaenopsis equestris TaxID=78828 RepID=UPI0009E60D0F|nr:28 kDa ribonucleoprotein, chloroplastic [Phalaenopsis equestris]XP_020581631.1 28 kDa ribonucleoprotein, chloroplastic [Phalaenopsis equestris]XP_020581632.1 28 kDa ribonucleoprotein, chloroplastic [Phalaenopsis equestris]